MVVGLPGHICESHDYINQKRLRSVLELSQNSLPSLYQYYLLQGSNLQVFWIGLETPAVHLPGVSKPFISDPRHFVLGRSPSKRRPQLKKPGTFQSFPMKRQEPWDFRNPADNKKHHCHGNPQLATTFLGVMGPHILRA